MNKNSFVLYIDSYEQIKKLNSEQKAALLDAIFQYAAGCDDLEFSDLVTEIVFGFIKSQMQRDSEKYEERKKRNSDYYKKKKENSENSVSENSENVFKTNSENSVSEKNCKNDSENSVCDNVYVNVNENVYGNDYVNVNVNENVNVSASADESRFTKEQIEALVDDYGEEIASEYIERFENYCKENNKHYKDNNKTIRDWIKKANIQKRDKHLDIYQSLVNNF